MCGIVGLFLKNSKLEDSLGKFIGEMLVKMSDRGPDSAGLALYPRNTKFDTKLTLRPFLASREEFFKGAILLENNSEYIIRDNFFFS